MRDTTTDETQTGDGCVPAASLAAVEDDDEGSGFDLKFYWSVVAGVTRRQLRACSWVAEQAEQVLDPHPMATPAENLKAGTSQR
ncbi:hypothetical protein PoB_004417900 [Plakobranchus ocellatus]|uniref:Uncharacterized protein n=1 Tax=Plakobranchus ocellatus TaxID=259542 RepID=A0AAV4BBZ2_9GAST|nr:hypothetical protein PoB_004417900 [Plakobranchus ocellatus]